MTSVPRPPEAPSLEIPQISPDSLKKRKKPLPPLMRPFSANTLRILVKIGERAPMKKVRKVTQNTEIVVWR
jgi:hypothetical protein